MLFTLFGVTVLFAIASFAIYSEKTETSGFAWWKETRDIPLDERRPE